MEFYMDGMNGQGRHHPHIMKCKKVTRYVSQDS